MPRFIFSLILRRYFGSEFAPLDFPLFPLDRHCQGLLDSLATEVLICVCMTVPEVLETLDVSHGCFEALL